MKNYELITVPEVFGKISTGGSPINIRNAVKKFRQNAPSLPIPRLYDAYNWLRNEINREDDESDKQFYSFIEVFLRILEERGAVNSEVYSEVLRDSAEYKYLAGLFHNDEPETEPDPVKIHYIEEKTEPEIKKITLKEILQDSSISLLDIDINEWHKLIDEHLKKFRAEEPFVKNCTLMINSIKKRTDRETYHIELIVAYAYETILKYKKISLKTKDFAMQLLNLMTGKGETWSRLHRDYLEIIRK